MAIAEGKRRTGAFGPVLLGGLIAVVLAASPNATAESLSELMDRFALSRYPDGIQAPEFRSCCHRGEELSLAALRGRVVLLNFWTTWCTECRKDIPALERLHKEFTPNGLTVVGINLRESQGAIERYAESLSLTFPLLSDARGHIQSAYGVVGTPTTFLVDREGQAVALAVGGRRWDSTLGRNLIQKLLVGGIR